ncbi:MAG: hypothetical protein WD469_09825 [Paenibacillaceae bacterium]
MQDYIPGHGLAGLVLKLGRPVIIDSNMEKISLLGTERIVVMKKMIII